MRCENMKRIKGSCGIRALGDYDFEFYVDDDVTESEIKQLVEDHIEYYCFYDVDEGYVAEQTTTYRKKFDWEK